MNKRQTKKKEKKELLLGGMTYREDRQITRDVKAYEISQCRSTEIPEDIEILVELGIYTWEDVERMRNDKSKEKRRWRQIERKRK